MSDLAKQLRSMYGHTHGCPDDCPLCRAAEIIEFMEYAKSDKVFEEIERLRAALQQIVDEIPPNEHKKWHHHHHYRFIAREALNGDK